MPPVNPVTWNDILAKVALDHSIDMDQNNYFSHTGLDGSSPGDRLTQAGYIWTSYGENIAFNYPDEQSVMNAWLQSEGHCKNIMDGGFKSVQKGHEGFGLMLTLTQRLTRSRSFQACSESTMSRAADGLVLHSGSYSAQNSIQPMGARVVSPVEMNSGRSSAVLPVAVANSASATMLAAALRLRIDLPVELIVTPSRLVEVTFRTKFLQRG